MKSPTSKVPVFRGKTAWELLDFITWVIQREPLRYYQGNWVTLVENTNGDYSFMPACGTIGCIAGWADILVTGRKFLLAELPVGRRTQERAAAILGLDVDQTQDLFNGQAIGKMREELDIAEALSSAGSEVYAELGVLHIRRFMLANERKLRRTKVRGKR